MKPEQGQLFPPEVLWRVRGQTGQYNVGPSQGKSPHLNFDHLDAWKQPIRTYQTQVSQAKTTAQVPLFDLETPPPTWENLNPFTLPCENTLFWRQKSSPKGQAAFYFVMDYNYPLLLYIGETGRSGQRWQGNHDCKQYLQNYVAAHRHVDAAVAVGIAFWYHAPSRKHQRQEQERHLILKWRSPFNKENWPYWHTPFRY
ncbi:GIY-YIG nuclease family protein [Candidatus Synechococcus calcipolaris G9]|uniref:GIY-YIG nuclease family protein n=1 Tax=Candidatus Synechococcus calcipolaris G9 TaxID=1497997 RepID=A0ABT6EZI7_9SYNE|nr:GIY-YIG nuclease family protein [Candidatus Synechococcus calcipolaris]MDG2990992.1 GIY-YIG nuclease family protein [Candidatus Synechococcus calcipolaris G9]